MKSEISTIQIRQSVKKELEKLKQKANDSYEDVIINLINEKESDKKEIEKKLIEMYKDEEFIEENRKIAKEWDSTLMDGLDPNEKWEEYENN